MEFDAMNAEMVAAPSITPYETGADMVASGFQLAPCCQPFQVQWHL